MMSIMHDGFGSRVEFIMNYNPMVLNELSYDIAYNINLCYCMAIDHKTRLNESNILIIKIMFIE